MPTREPTEDVRARSDCIFLFMPRPPPSSTLFPYTTLFRSRRGVRSGDGDERLPQRPAARPGPRAGVPVDAREDRKSTRLNSSHMSISYAVFCLKKKKLDHLGL